MKPFALKIRAAKPLDADALEPFDEFAGDRRAEIASGRCMVAQLGEDVVGYVSWIPEGFVGNPLITFLCVAPDNRRKGIGGTLLAGAERRIQAGKIFVSTEAHNAAMLSLLAKQGWTLAGSVASANEDGSTEAFFLKERLGGFTSFL